MRYTGISRRKFLGGCAVCAGAAGLMGAPGWLRAASGMGRQGTGLSSGEKLRIRILYALHAAKQDRPDWPNIGFDFVPVMEAANAELLRNFPGWTFIPTLAAEQARKILEEDKAAPVDGYIVYQMNCWNEVAQTMALSAKPVLYADFQYAGSGGFLVYTAAFLRANTRNVGFVASSYFSDMLEAVRCFGEAKAAGPSFDFAAATARVRRMRTPGPSKLDCRTSSRPFQRPRPSSGWRPRRSWLSATIRAARHRSLWAFPSFRSRSPRSTKRGRPRTRMRRGPLPTDGQRAPRALKASVGELVNSAAMYLGQKAVLKKYGANAITINCSAASMAGTFTPIPVWRSMNCSTRGSWALASATSRPPRRWSRSAR